MKKTKIIIILLATILISLVMLLASSRRSGEAGPEPIPVYTPVRPSPGQFNYQPISEEEQIIAERNYAKEREKVLTEKPWLLKMPLRNEDYWLTYSTEFDVFDALIYISPKFPRDEQIISKKARIAKDLAAIGVDVNKAKINYTEKEI